MTNQTSIREVPIHPLAAFLTIVVDLGWGVFEIGSTAALVTIVLVIIGMICSFAMTFVGVFLVQKAIAKDRLMESTAKAFVMGVTAGVPYFIVGTIVGGTLLGWAGIRRLNSDSHEYLEDKPRKELD